MEYELLGRTTSYCTVKKAMLECAKVYIVVIQMKRKDWDVTSHLYNSLMVLDYLSLYNLYNSLFMLDFLFSLEPIICSHD